jgi:phosphatidate cytidylyltransferase
LNPVLDSAPAPESQPKKGPSNLRLRAIWGALAAALLFGCTFGGPISFGLFFAGVQAIMLKEFYRIMRAGGTKPVAGIGIIAGTFIFSIITSFLLFVRYFPLGTNTLGSISGGTNAEINRYLGDTMLTQSLGMSATLVLLVLLITTVTLWLYEMRRWPDTQQPFQNIAVTLGGLLYVSLPMSFLSLIALSHGNYTPRRVFFLIFLIWAADTGAYFAGKNLGKHKLAPRISPGKTWEGWAGGALLTLAVGWAAGYFLPDIPLSHRLVAAGVVAIFGPLGDLAESMLKRSAGVKDSGTFLPGHGGLLDRFDAFLLVLPVLALLQVLVG